MKAAPIRPSPLKGPSPLDDQYVVVVRQNTQADVEGFMVDRGESPSKKASKEVPSPFNPLDFVEIYIHVLVHPTLFMQYRPF